MDASEGGRRILSELMAPDYVQQKDKNLSSFNEVVQPHSEEICLGRIRARDGIDRRQRSVVDIAIPTALNRPAQLSHHIEGAPDNGRTVDELKQTLFQTAVHCGLPAAGEAFRVAEEVLRRRGLLD
ncbi:carboxymuconolactone decarboxylase family protein [Streptomyces phaeochromogenes]|uniref:carboxymuconolactone decarboxylase family protein n=1 Tax=Streptomyces phaeochromogenes TaxID=1923 RepID=UPI0033D5B69B